MTDIADTLTAHVAWLTGTGGARAVLTGADLTGADLTGANLAGADLTGAYLAGAKLPAGMALIQVHGSRVPLVAISTSEGLEVRSGCQHHQIGWWHKNGVKLARVEEYSDAQIAEASRPMQRPA